MADTAERNGSPDTSGIRACDQCRTRKIRCDKEIPCSNCKVAKRTCSSTGPSQKPREARQRVLISTQYERKIDQIEERLASIERLLRASLAAPPSRSEVGTGSADPATYSRQDAASCTPSLSITSSPYDQDEVESVFEGDSSLTAHTAFAREFLEHAVERTSLQDVSRDMSTVVMSLRQMVNMQNPQARSHGVNFPHQKPLPPGGLRAMPMPPMQLVVGMLREVKDTDLTTFRLAIPFLSMDEFTEYCRLVYFATKDISPSLFVIANTGLYYLFMEKLDEERNEIAVAQLRKHANMCRDNLETGYATMTMFPSARKENIQALLLGAAWAVEQAKPTLAWQMTSAACHLCLTLGYHRAGTYKIPSDGSVESRPLLFWLVYMLDKNIALSLGRASILKDYDITLPRDALHLAIGPEWRLVHNNWIKFSEIQGHIYEKLYSPGALQQPQSDRVAVAYALAAELKALAADSSMSAARYAGLDSDNPKYAALLMTHNSDEVAQYASLTLTYRALPPLPGHGRTFHPECVDMARETMRAHHHCLRAIPDNEYMASAYIHWTILYAPFIPFVVLFCYVIETSDMDDLRRLADFVASIEVTRNASLASEKLHRLCQLLYNTATLYVEAKRHNEQQGHGPVPDPGLGSEVNMYLNALGLMPTDMSVVPADGGGGGGEQMMGPHAGMDGNLWQTTQLGEWFMGNSHMINVLEGDMMTWPGVEGPPMPRMQ